MMPGKNDAKRSEISVKVQKLILCDYLNNLFDKFKLPHNIFPTETKEHNSGVFHFP